MAKAEKAENFTSDCIIPHYRTLRNVPKQKNEHLPGIFAITLFPPISKHLAHIHRRPPEHLVPYMRVDVRRSLIVRVSNDLHRDQRIDTDFIH